MRAFVAALFLFVMVVSCGGSRPASSTSGGHGLHSNPCDYLSTTDFKQTLGMSLVGFRAGTACTYRDQRGDTCQVTVVNSAGQYATSRTVAAGYGTVETLAVGDQGFYSSQAQTPGVWIFDIGLMKSGNFAGAVCGGQLGTTDPKPRAVRLADLIASRI